MWHLTPPREFVAKVSKLPKDKAPSTFGHQTSLPPLPVPSLDETCKKYLESVKPAVSAEQYERTRAVVEAFRTGEGPHLQRRLEEHASAEGAKGRSWLEEWWLLMAYHAWQDPLPITSNWYSIYRDHPIALSSDVHQLTRATELIGGVLLYKVLMEKGLVPPDTARKQPICMDQLTRVFSTTRLPGVQADRIVTFPLAQSSHIVVMRKDQIYAVDVLDPSLNLLPPEHLQAQLKAIMEDSETDATQPPVGILTSERRDVWARAREQLEASPKNKHSLDLIDRALFVLCLDDSAPSTRDEVAQASFHNHNGRNRWFDKSFSVIIFKNGKAGLNAEHSPLDAPALAHGCSMFAAYNETVESYTKIRQHLDEPRPRDLALPKRLEWDVTPQVMQAIRDAGRHATEFIAKYHTRCLEFEDFGSEFLKEHRLSPDAFIQMAIQLAYYKIHRTSTPTYETAQTRKFFHGRTETVRTLSSQSVRFVEAMENPNVQPKEKVRLLLEGMEHHNKTMLDASEGRGVDRHLLGLMMAAKTGGEELPALFTDPSFTISRTFRLSTSNLTPAPEFYGGFGPMCEDGYGVCYALRPAGAWFSVSSMVTCPRTDTLLMISALKSSLRDLRSLVLSTAPPSAPSARL